MWCECRDKCKSCYHLRAFAFFMTESLHIFVVAIINTLHLPFWHHITSCKYITVLKVGMSLVSWQLRNHHHHHHYFCLFVRLQHVKSGCVTCVLENPKDSSLLGRTGQPVCRNCLWTTRNRILYEAFSLFIFWITPWSNNISWEFHSYKVIIIINRVLFPFVSVVLY